MASIYQKRNVWYISIMHDKKRITRSLGTKDKKVAKQLKSHVESQIILELTGIIKSNLDLRFSEIVPRFLKADHNWSPSTYDLNQYILTSYLKGNPLPSNPSSRATHIRHINQCWKWGVKKSSKESSSYPWGYQRRISYSYLYQR